MISVNIVGIGLALAAAIPSGLIAFLFWGLERRIQKRDEREQAERKARREELDERDNKRMKNEIMTFQAVTASLSLAEVTAEAVQRIPDAHCNGEMKEALAYAKDVKHKQREFLENAGLTSIYVGRDDK